MKTATLKPKRALTTEQKITKLLQTHPLMSVFVLDAMLKQAEQVMEQDECPWPENSWISWLSWKACAVKVNATFGQQGE